MPEQGRLHGKLDHGGLWLVDFRGSSWALQRPTRSGLRRPRRSTSRPVRLVDRSRCCSKATSLPDADAGDVDRQPRHDDNRSASATTPVLRRGNRCYHPPAGRRLVRAGDDHHLQAQEVIAFSACAALVLCAQEQAPTPGQLTGYCGRRDRSRRRPAVRAEPRRLVGHRRSSRWRTSTSATADGPGRYARAQVPRAGDNPTPTRAACSSKRAFRPELLWRRALGARTGDARRFEKHREPSTCCRDAHRPATGVGAIPTIHGYLVDLSNTQYAALALRAAQHAGSKVPKGVWSTWSKACS